MTLDEAVGILRLLADRHPDGTSWDRGGGYVVAEFYAPDENDSVKLSEALIQMDEALSILLAIYDASSARYVTWGNWAEDTRPLLARLLNRQGLF